MVIYIDLIIILNFIIDLLLLISVSLLLKRHPKIIRIITASLIGSLSTIILFYFNNTYLLFSYKIIISILMIIIAFKYESFSYFKENIFWLYIISIILGGSLYLINNQVSLSKAGLIFKKNDYKLNICLLLIIGFLLILKFIKEQKKYYQTYSNYYNVSIYYNDVKIKGIGFLDTGNKLKDPYFNKPIILVNKDLIKEDVSYFLVPYDSLNNHNLLKVFKPKFIIVNKKIKKNILIGLSDINLNGIKIILNTEAI
jgi:stage II sporulation protein GA (sporulation sigma-E factor processing peptidase)